MIYEEPRFLTGGDKAILVELGDTIDPKLNHRVRNLMLAILKARIRGIIESVPTYRSLLVYYDPLEIGPKELRETLHVLVQQLEEGEFPKPKTIEIPTVYGGEYGPDVEFVATYNGLSVQEVVQIHTGTPYLVYMLGFIPGFPYLGGMSPRIATPRMETPRTNIPAGSVGVAENQTGIYPTESPGGWRVIGRTPLKLFDPNREPPALLRTGYYLTFVSITPEEFTRITEEVERRTYFVRETLLG